MLVIGSGLAGLAAADRLLDAGLKVVVIDAFPVPGGRTASFDIAAPVAGLVPGDVVEHGLHAWFQHYHALFELMARAGVPKPPFTGDGIHFWNPAQGHVVVEGGPLTWLIQALRLPHAMRGPRHRALAAFSKLIRELNAAVEDDLETDRLSAGALLRHQGVPEQAIAHVFSPCVYSLTSLRIDELSALEMLRWMSSILPDPRIRMVHGGSTPAMSAPIVESLRARGAEFRFGVEVTRMGVGRDGRIELDLAQAPDRTGLRHVLVSGFSPAAPPNPRDFDAFVCTLPWERLSHVTRDDASLRNHPAWIAMRQLDNVHPLTIRLWFEKPIEGADEHYVLASGTLFDVLRPTPEPQRYPGVRLMDLLVENIDSHLPELGFQSERFLPEGPQAKAIVDRVLFDLERMYPGRVRSNRVLRQFLHTREGIVACRPGSWWKRAPHHVDLPNLVLAGDWTRQPHGVCMEGAVRSGHRAVESLLRGKPVSTHAPPFEQTAYSLRSIFQRT